MGFRDFFKYFQRKSLSKRNASTDSSKDDGGEEEEEEDSVPSSTKKRRKKILHRNTGRSRTAENAGNNIKRKDNKERSGAKPRSESTSESDPVSADGTSSNLKIIQSEHVRPRRSILKKRSSIKERVGKIDTFLGSIFRRILEINLSIVDILNYLIFGYICGVIITILWYNYMDENKVNIYRWAFFTVVIFAALLLSYSKDVRCTLVLTIPLLCSSRGRSLIMAFGFFLAASGPIVNMFSNIDVMMSSLTCGQMQLRQALSDILDTLKKPLVSIKDAIGVAIEQIKVVMKKVQVVMLRIEMLVLILLSSIKNAFEWLRSIVSVCNKEYGTPFERCMQTSATAMEDCRNLLGAIKGLCHLTHIFSMMCYPAKVVDAVCVLVAFISDAIIGKVIEKLNAFKNEIKKLFDVSIHFDHDFYFKTTTSKELSNIRNDIMKDLKHRMGNLLYIFGWLDFISLALVIWVIIKATYFRMKYVRSPGYHNYFITNEFLEIDEKRRSHGMEVALPLRVLERFKYPKLSDCRLTKREIVGIARSFMFLVITDIQLFCICFADYCLFWTLAMLSYYGHKQKGFEPPDYITIEVKGKGFVSEVFRGVVHAFDPTTQNNTIDPQNCLPLPIPPNYRCYYLIAFLCVLAWLCVFSEPYVLRLRHVIMHSYYPSVSRKRAVWLYNRILLNRMTLFKLARRKARSIFKQNKKLDNFKLADWFRNKTDRFWICRFILGPVDTDKCLLCSTPLSNETRTKCATIGCGALYCKECYKESSNICCICTNPLEYGDLSDITDVEDSSDDSRIIHRNPVDDECLMMKNRQRP